MLNLIWLLPVALFFSYLINYFADIMPLGKGLLKYPCTQCSQDYSFADYFKFSNCKSCGRKLSLRHWIILIISVALVVVIWFFPPLKNSRFPGFIYFYLFLFFYFMLVFIIDLEHREILYFLSTIGLIACIGIGIWLHEEKVTCLSSTNKPILNGVINTLIGCITGALVMFGLYLLGLLFNRIISRIRKTKVDEVALGFGDVILSGILGALLGFPGIFACLALGILMGGLFSLVYIIVMKIKGKFQALTAIPYAPFLIISAMVLLYVAK